MTGDGGHALAALGARAFTPELLDALGHLAPADETPALEVALLRSMSAKDPRVRNAAAMALADMRSDLAPSVILGLLMSQRTSGSRGTLLYALRRMRGRLPLHVVHVLLRAGGEGAEEVVNFIEDGLIEPFPRATMRSFTRFLRVDAGVEDDPAM